jgi:hypothetical protein
MTGTLLDALEHVPRAIFARVVHQPVLLAPELGTLRALHRRHSTLFEHQAPASAHAGAHWLEATDETAAVAATPQSAGMASSLSTLATASSDSFQDRTSARDTPLPVLALKAARITSSMSLVKASSRNRLLLLW